jgi:hypothetical protein
MGTFVWNNGIATTKYEVGITVGGQNLVVAEAGYYVVWVRARFSSGSGAPTAGSVAITDLPSALAAESLTDIVTGITAFSYYIDAHTIIYLDALGEIRIAASITAPGTPTMVNSRVTVFKVG